MIVLGLTGGSGCGKGYVSAMFAEHGIPSLDCDAVSRQVCEKGSPCLAEIACALGDAVLTDDGHYDRAATARIVFGDSEKLAVLSRITHKYILEKCREWLGEQEKKGLSVAIIDAPVLYESGFDAECDVVVAVVADTETRIARIMKRDGIDEEMAIKRISKQKPMAFYREKADYLIENGANAQKDALILRVAQIVSALKGSQA